MGIEKDIHQNVFTNVKQKAIVNLLFTYGWTIERLKNFSGGRGYYPPAV
jgi:MarR family 2-MHQ and catechol resistance regulon transcriptional repressor